VQSGLTAIEDDVEIQTLTSVDRATVGETRVKRGAKIDSLVQVGHACTVGEDNIICAQTGLAGSTVLTQMLPQWALEGGIDGLLRRLADPGERRQIGAEAECDLAQGWDGIQVSAVGSAKNGTLVGLSLAAIAGERHATPLEAMLDLLVEERGNVNILEINQSEENLREALCHPLANVISDGFYVNGRPHPRLHGTFPHLLGEICRDRGWMTLEQAIAYIEEDELVEVTPQSIRLRKRERDPTLRKRQARADQDAG